MADYSLVAGASEYFHQIGALQAPESQVPVPSEFVNSVPNAGQIAANSAKSHEVSVIQRQGAAAKTRPNGHSASAELATAAALPPTPLFPAWLDQQGHGPSSSFAFGTPSASEFPLAFDYGQMTAAAGMGLASAVAYPPPPQPATGASQDPGQEAQNQQQLFAVGGLYDSLAAAAALAGQIGTNPAMAGNSFWPGDFYGTPNAHWQQWAAAQGYADPLQYPGPGFEQFYGAGGAYGPPQEYAAGIQQGPQDWPHQTVAMMAAAAAASGQAQQPTLTVTGTGRAAGIGGKRSAGGTAAQKVGPSCSQHHLAVPSSSGNGQRRSSTASTARASSASSASPSAAELFNCPQALADLQSSRARGHQLSPLLAHLPPVQSLTRAAVRDYLASPGRFECAIWIFHARVAQKSYGNEKRFFCPPPCVYLLGEGWRARRKTMDQMFRQVREQLESKRNSPAKDSLLLTGEAGRELFSELVASVGINPAQGGEKLSAQQTAHQLDFSNGKDYCAAKALFISDSDKRKHFHLQAHFSYAGGAIEVGHFPSQKIKVISKPSKKKQSMKSSDCKYLCVSNGSKIALFNRLRSQTVSTRYLHVENGCFHASSTKWGAFHIHSVEDCFASGQQKLQNGSSQPNPPAIITYGSTVQLVDSHSNIALPILRIRKVDKQMVLLDPAGQGEPVSQLHKCAFQMVNSGGAPVPGQEVLYLCLSHDKIIQHQAIRIDAHRHQISDGAAWTIISTDKSEYRWAEPLASNGGLARMPVTPLPQVHSLNVAEPNGQKATTALGQLGLDPKGAIVELNGSHFAGTHRVWFGATPAETTFCSPERLSCAVPSLHAVCADLGFSPDAALANASNGKLDVPILVARDEDGLIYPTAMSFPYSLNGLPNQMPMTDPTAMEQQQSGPSSIGNEASAMMALQQQCPSHSSGTDLLLKTSPSNVGRHNSEWP